MKRERTDDSDTKDGEKHRYDEIGALYVQLSNNGNTEAFNNLQSLALIHNNLLAIAFLQLSYFLSPHDWSMRSESKAAELVEPIMPWLIEVCSVEEHDSFPYSLYVYAINLEVGIGVERNTNKSFELVEKAASYDYPPAMTALASNYQSELYETHDNTNEKAFILYKRPALLDYLPAIEGLGYCCYSGTGTSIDRNLALHYFQIASDRGNLLATCWLGDLYLNGDCVAKNIDKAVSLYQSAADKHSPFGYSDLAWCYCNGVGVARNILYGKELYRLSIDVGKHMYPVAQLEFVRLLLTTPEDHTEAFLLAKQAAEFTKFKIVQNASKMRIFLAKCYVCGYGTPKDEALGL